MKVLIVTMNCGEGHNAIARSIRDGFGPEDEVKIVNLYGYLGKRDRRGKAYLFMVKHVPNLYSAIWNRCRVMNPERRYRGYAASGIRSAAREMEKVVSEFRPDAVVCTHVNASNVFCWMKIHNRFQGKLYSVVFDYVVCPFWEGSVLCDGVFTPHEMTHKDLIAKGFREEQLFAYGFPVHRKFDREIDKAEARRALGLHDNDFVVLSVNGGMGVGNVEGLAKKLATVKLKDRRLTSLVVCGNNRKAYERLSAYVKKRGIENVRVNGFVDNMEVMLAASDLFFCRGGGGAITEAINSGVPFVVREGAVNQERANAKLFSKLGICASMKRLSDAEKIIRQFADTESPRGGVSLFNNTQERGASQRSSLIFADRRNRTEIKRAETIRRVVL